MIRVCDFMEFNENYQDDEFEEFMKNLDIKTSGTEELLGIPFSVNSTINVREQLEQDLKKIQIKYELSFEPDTYASIDEMYSALDRMYEKVKINK